MEFIIHNLFNLQYFADEGDAGQAETSADEGAADTTGSATESGDDTSGEQAAPAEEPSFDDLIKGKYKDDYAKAVQGAIQKRFRNQEDLQGRINAIDPVVRELAHRYGIQTNPDGSIPIDRLQQALDNDQDALEKEAFAKGMTVDDYRQYRALERENAQYKAQAEQQARQAEWENIQAQAQAMQAQFPAFNLETEMQNPAFASMLATLQHNGVANAVRTAYTSLHFDELMTGGMQYAQQQAEQKISNSVRSGSKRPAENGTTGASAGTAAVDINSLSREQIDDYIARAQRGEKISFT